jgi:hypothetical protein
MNRSVSVQRNSITYREHEISGVAMTDFNAIRAVLAVFPPADGWSCTKVGWRQSIRIEHPEYGMRVCRVSEEGVVTVLYAGDRYTPPVLPHRMAAARKLESACLVH